MENKTAIQQLIIELEEDKKGRSDLYDGIEHALQLLEHYMTIEEKQIVDAFNEGEDLGDRRNYTGEKYYKERFKTVNRPH